MEISVPCADWNYFWERRHFENALKIYQFESNYPNNVVGFKFRALKISSNNNFISKNLKNQKNHFNDLEIELKKISLLFDAGLS